MLVVGQLLLAEVQLKLKFKFFKGPRVILSDCLSCGSKERFRVKQSSEPEASLSKCRINFESLQLCNSLYEVGYPSSDLNTIRDLVLVPFGRRYFSKDLLCDETQLVGAFSLTVTHLFQENQVAANCFQKGGSDIHFSI